MLKGSLDEQESDITNILSDSWVSYYVWVLNSSSHAQILLDKTILELQTFKGIRFFDVL